MNDIKAMEGTIWTILDINQAPILTLRVAVVERVAGLMGLLEAGVGCRTSNVAGLLKFTSDREG